MTSIKAGRCCVEACCITYVLLLFFSAPSFGESEQVIVLGNRKVPESTELIRHYMAVRSIPQANLCMLDLPQVEDLSRAAYEKDLRDPLLVFLRDGGFIAQDARASTSVGPHETAWVTTTSSVYAIVSMYGVPTRIVDTKSELLTKVTNWLDGHNTDVDGASVDSELALLLHPPYSIVGPYRNPVYGELFKISTKFTANRILIAGRLDGDSPETVKRMIDDMIYAEKYGVQGRAYFDARNITNELYATGDYWIVEAYERLKREGYESAIDYNAGLWSEVVPMEDAAWYLGWYAGSVVGPFLRDDFNFTRGAFAYHLHSSSAKTLRTKTAYWAGPLLAKGAAGTMGAVAEPFLSFTPHLHILIDRLCRGYNLGESSALAQRALSWQMTVVGDPLYRPFKRSLDEQIQSLEADRRPELAWAYVRKINVLVRNGRFNVALKYCRDRLARTKSPILREKLGDLYAENEIYSAAAAEYEEVVREAGTAATALRVGAKRLALLRYMKEMDQDDQEEAILRGKWGASPMVEWLGVASVRE